ncbi:MAG: hypothetical protein WBD16_07675 [Pyrinomonadaceae bacterium]
MRLFLVVLSFVICSSFIFAQDGIQVVSTSNSFAGKWVLDKTKSDAGMGMKVSFADSTLVVSQDAREIVMTSTTIMDGKQSIEKTVYSIDGTSKGTVKIDGGAKVAAKWDGKKLVVFTKSVIAAIKQGGRSPVMETKEEWSVSKDGNTLTQTISGNGIPNMPEMKSKFVYSRIRGE